jgi:hypothetical protein
VQWLPRVSAQWLPRVVVQRLLVLTEIYVVSACGTRERRIGRAHRPSDVNVMSMMLAAAMVVASTQGSVFCCRAPVTQGERKSPCGSLCSVIVRKDVSSISLSLHA